VGDEGDRVVIDGAGWTTRSHLEALEEAQSSSDALGLACLWAMVCLMVVVYLAGWKILGSPGGAWGWLVPARWWTGG
jgi:hypothetical protein